MNRLPLALLVMTTSSAAVGAVASPGVVEPSTERMPRAAAQAGGLCGMTPTKVQDIIDVYVLDTDMESFAQNALQQPFDCGAYGALCDVLPETRARTYACNVWNALDQHQELSAIREASIAFIRTHGTRCAADASLCETHCAPDTAEVCLGKISPLNGSCETLVVCDGAPGILGFGPMFD